ncbi:hypothetical protein PFISCL1PPCAC_18215, partial [Pristionchus fissidentatus]
QLALNSEFLRLLNNIFKGKTVATLKFVFTGTPEEFDKQEMEEFILKLRPRSLLVRDKVLSSEQLYTQRFVCDFANTGHELYHMRVDENRHPRPTHPFLVVT